MRLVDQSARDKHRKVKERFSPRLSLFFDTRILWYLSNARGCCINTIKTDKDRDLEEVKFCE